MKHTNNLTKSEKIGESWDTPFVNAKGNDSVKYFGQDEGNKVYSIKELMYSGIDYVCEFGNRKTESRIKNMEGFGENK